MIGAFHIINNAEKDKVNLLKIRKLIKNVFKSVMLNRKVSLKHKLKYILFLLFPLQYDKIRKNLKE